MTTPWWDQDGGPSSPRLEARPDEIVPSVRRPIVFPAELASLIEELRGRRRAYTPTWTTTAEDDPGLVLIDRLAAQFALTARTAPAANATHGINDLPTKARVDLLRIAGIAALGPAPMTTVLTFTISPAARVAVTIGAGFAATGTDVEGNPVRFETDRSLVASPAKLAGAATEQDGVVQPIKLPELDRASPIAPFGPRPKPGNSFWLGIEAAITPGPRLGLAYFVPVRGDAPPPISIGGSTPSVNAAPVLAWDTFDGREWVAAEVLRDDSTGFRRSGVIELAVDREWPATELVAGVPPLRWLRATLVRGRYDLAAELAGVAINAVTATAGETRRDEILAPIEVSGRRPDRFRLARGNVVEGSLRLIVDEGGTVETWTEVADLAGAGPEERAYLLEAAAGIVRFGDGTHGRPVPEGFRHVQAASYRVVAPSLRVEANTVTSAIGSAPFVAGVTNPRAPSGQRAGETLVDVLRRGPRELRARDRAVNPADYEVMALRSAGVRRATAIPGHHPNLPGRPIPGLVGVLAVAEPRDDARPPIPDEETLGGLARFLHRNVAPAGVEIVAAAPRFEDLAVDADVVLDAGADVGVAIATILRVIDAYFDPLRGGADRTGWPFGGTIDRNALVSHLLDGVEELRSIPRLVLVLDGVRSTTCGDVRISANALLWPGNHLIFPLEDAP